MKFYTNARIYGNSVLHRWIEIDDSGTVTHRLNRDSNFQPTVFSTSTKETGWTNLYGVNVIPKVHDDIRSAKDWIKEYSSVDGIEIHSLNDFMPQYLAEKYPGKIEFDVNSLRIFYLDIEVTVGNEFPDPTKAEQPITAITVYDTQSKIYSVFGTKECDLSHLNRPDVVFYNCGTEKKLITSFVSYWKSVYPDIISGWNIDGFDIPYLINRITGIYGEEFTKTLSPWNRIEAKETEDKVYGNVRTEYDIWGIESLDYLELYRKYHTKKQESYSLGYIATEELGVGKIEFEGSLNDLYENDYQKYIEYNVTDVERVVQIDAKVKMIRLQTELAYRSKLNYSDVYGPVKLWTSIIFHALWERNQVLPPRRSHKKGEQYEGAYVVEPQIGLHEWAVSLDATSLYPSMIMSYNISPETIVQSASELPEELQPYYKTNLVNTIKDGKLPSEVTESLQKYDLTLAANGQFYSRETHGILPKLVDDMFKDRKKAKTEMLKLKSLVEAEGETPQLAASIGALSVTEQGLKVCLNSLYGALGNQYFHLFDIRNAEAITLAGQVSLTYVSSRMSKWLSSIDGKDTNHIIAGDTDSMFLDLSGIVAKLPGTRDQAKTIDVVAKFADSKMNEVAKKICRELGQTVNMYDIRLDFKREKVIPKLAYLAKKRYICIVGDSEGVRYKKPELSCTGVETNRSSTPKIIRGALEDVFYILLTEDQEAVRNYVAKIKDQFDKEAIETIAFPRGVSNIGKYDGVKDTPPVLYRKGTPEHVKAALLYNALLKSKKLTGKYERIQNGDKIKFIKLNPQNPTRESVIGFKDVWPVEFGLNDYIDKNQQLNTAFTDPLVSVLDKIGWSLEDKPSVEDFF